MLADKQLLFSIFILLFLSCNHEHSYTFAIKDFRKSLQPRLKEVVSKGIVKTYALNEASDKEIMQLAQSEHPVLRATAYGEMLHRKSFNHFAVLMNHLDDTATIEMDAGEFGIWAKTISDYILFEAKWKTKESKDKTINEVLTRHNYLESAYQILLRLEPQEKYHSIIKDMATRPRYLNQEGYELGFADIEYALYGLAKFKEKQDVEIIKQQLLKNVSSLSYISFQLMKEFPDSAYMDVLQEYHKLRFYRFSGYRRNGFSGYNSDRAEPEDFIRALAVQKNDRSARIMDTILHRLPTIACFPQKESVIGEMENQIWQHPCPSYQKLREELKKQGVKESDVIITPGHYKEPIDTNTSEHIRW